MISIGLILSSTIVPIFPSPAPWSLCSPYYWSVSWSGPGQRNSSWPVLVTCHVVSHATDYGHQVHTGHSYSHLLLRRLGVHLTAQWSFCCFFFHYIAHITHCSSCTPHWSIQIIWLSMSRFKLYSIHFMVIAWICDYNIFFSYCKLI